MKKLVRTIIVCCMLLSVQVHSLIAQDRLIKRAEHNLKNEQYERAYNLYHKHWQKNQHDANVIGKLAQISEILEDYPKAEQWYLKLIDLGVATDKDAYMCLKMMYRNENYKQAHRLLKELNRDSEILSDKYFMPFDSIKSQKENNDYGGVIIADKINGSYSEMNPAFYLGNKLVFLSDRVKTKTIHRRQRRTGNAYYSLYSVTHSKVGYTISDYPVLFSKETNTQYNIGSVTFNADGTEMFFTKNERSDKKNSKKYYLQL
ncbi:MAG: hypothetical protein MI866_12610, partial [Bacteroidales bacterium]|nr:hypothetical protein [Bacteroidales bacterium]